MDQLNLFKGAMLTALLLNVLLAGWAEGSRGDGAALVQANAGAQDWRRGDSDHWRRTGPKWRRAANKAVDQALQGASGLCLPMGNTCGACWSDSDCAEKCREASSSRGSVKCPAAGGAVCFLFEGVLASPASSGQLKPCCARPVSVNHHSDKLSLPGLCSCCARTDDCRPLVSV